MVATGKNAIVLHSKRRTDKNMVDPAIGFTIGLTIIEAAMLVLVSPADAIQLQLSLYRRPD